MKLFNNIKRATKDRDQEYVIKMGFVFMGLFFVLMLIIGDYFWHLIFDPSQFDATKWGNRAIFNGSISLATMVLGFIALLESYKSKENGKYQSRLKAFNDKVTEIYNTVKILYFDQFINWYAERQLWNKKVKHLTSHGIPRLEAEVIIKYATESDIETLSGISKNEEPKGEYGEDIVREVDGKEILIPAILDTQACYVEEVLNGTIGVHTETASYYLSIGKNRKGNLESLERPMSTEEDRVRAMKISFISKVIISLVYATLFSLLFVDLNGDTGTAEALWNALLRIISATLGFISGGLAGLTDGKFQYKEIGEKMRVQMEYSQYFDNGEFVPQTYEQTAQKRIEEYHKKKAERLAEVVDAPKPNEPKDTKPEVLQLGHEPILIENKEEIK